MCIRDRGYIATANNRVVDDAYPYLLSTDWAPPYRAERIVELIEQMSSNGDTISLDDVAAMQADRTSTQVRALLPFLLTVTPADARQQQAIDLLQHFDGEMLSLIHISLSTRSELTPSAAHPEKSHPLR